MQVCINHPERPSEWHCRDCGRNLCPDCVDTIVVQHQRVEICRDCRGKCERLDLPVEPGVDEPSFSAGTPSAVLYPIRGYGVAAVILAPLILYVIAKAAGWLVSWIPLIGFLLHIVIALIYYGYIALLLVGIAKTSAEGQKTPPLVVGFAGGDTFGATLMPLFLMIITTILSFGPAVGYYLLFGRQIDPVVVALGVIGAFYYPMALLAVSVFGFLEALSPGPILKSIRRIPGQYLLACVLFYLLLALGLLVRAHLDFKPSFYAGAARLLVSIYSWAVALHIIGRLYYCNRSKLRWVA